MNWEGWLLAGPLEPEGGEGWELVMTQGPLENRNAGHPTVEDTRKLLAQVTCFQRVTGGFWGTAVSALF